MMNMGCLFSFCVWTSDFKGNPSGMFLDPAPIPLSCLCVKQGRHPLTHASSLSIRLPTDPEIICSTAFRFTSTLTTFSFYIGLHDFNKNAISEEWLFIWRTFICMYFHETFCSPFLSHLFSLRIIRKVRLGVRWKVTPDSWHVFVLQGEGSIGTTLMPDLDAGCRRHFSLFKAY